MCSYGVVDDGEARGFGGVLLVDEMEGIGIIFPLFGVCCALERENAAIVLEMCVFVVGGDGVVVLFEVHYFVVASGGVFVNFVADFGGEMEEITLTSGSLSELHFLGIQNFFQSLVVAFLGFLNCPSIQDI